MNTRRAGWLVPRVGAAQRLDGAEEAFLAAHEAGWDPQPGLALVRLAQGNVDQAAASIRDVLDHPSTVPSKERPPNNDLRRAPLLAAQVEIGVAAGDLDRARWAAGELGRVAARFESKALAASAALAHGTVRLAEGDAAGAQRHFEEAAQLWNEVGAPYKTGLARKRLADAYRAKGNDERALPEFRAARSTFEGVGAMPERARVTDVSSVVGPEGFASELSAFRREGDYWSVTFQGRTVHVKDLKGMRYLARLLADPGREFHVVDLVTAESGGTAPAERTARPELGFSAPGDAGEMLDARAKEAYGGVSPRSTMTSTRRGPGETASGRPKRKSSVISSCASSHARSASGAATGAPVPHPNGPESA